MKNTYVNDTIAAISTPVGEGGIGIVRLSGSSALSIADRIFASKNGNGRCRKPSKSKSFTTHYGWITDIDEVILTVMRSPRSYTKEDIVEINCHSGIVPLKKILELVLASGARLAHPGEFTKRAFLNGRIDLSQAEAVMDLVKSKTEVSLRQAVLQLKGRISEKVKGVSTPLMEILAHLEASIDFPEEELGLDSKKDMANRLKKAHSQLEALYKTASYGTVIKQGIMAVIVGRPNVGKSSLLNAMLKQDRAIVTHIAGTTVDTIEETVDINGIPIRLVDTAGIIRPRDLIQKEAVAKSNKYLEAADLVLLMLDASRPVAKEDKSIIERIKNKDFLVVLNKSDLPRKVKLGSLKTIKNKRKIRTSAVKETGLAELKDVISDFVWQGKAQSCHEVMITNSRHKEAVRKTLGFIGDARNSLKKSLSEEFIAQDLKEALDELGTITGESVREDLLDRIFSEFCIGK